MFSIEYKYFHQAAIDKSIRKAAETLCINSSAVVRQIHKLEGNLDIKLFNRSTKGLELTSEGNLLFNYVSEKIENNQIFLKEIKNTKGKISGVINISTGETIAVHFFSEIIKNFSLEYPDLQFNIVARKPDSIIDDVLTNKSEIGITFTKEIPKSLKIFSQSNYPVGILCSPRHLLSGKDKVFVEDCIKFPLVFHPGTLTVWKKIQRNMGLKPFTPKPKLIANSFALIKNYLIKDENSIAFFTKLGAVNEINQGLLTYKTLENDILINNKIGIVISKNKKLDFVRKKLIDELSKQLTKYENVN